MIHYAQRHPGPYHVCLVPHSHLDVEWYWTFDKTRAWSRTIFRDALRLLEREPEEAFAQDQVPLLELIAEELGEDGLRTLRSWMDAGRFEAVGGTYVQPEVAEPHGECLVRQFLFGRKRVREMFGVAPTVGWFIDTFGQVPQIAQILLGCGMDAYVFERGVPSELGEPPSAFWHESPDGTRILTWWMSSGYTTFERNLEESLKEEVAHASSPYLMLAWGMDVSTPREMPALEAKAEIMRIARRSDIPLASVRITTPGVFFRELRANAEDLPVLGEDFAPPEDRFADLRGTYSNRVRLKLANRQAEGALLTAESWAALAGAFGAAYPKGVLDLAWERLLYNHFHDIMGGSCADQVYLKALKRFGTVVDLSEDATDRAIAGLMRRVDTAAYTYPLAVVNSTSSARTDVVEFEMVFREEPTNFRIVDDEGGPAPAHISEPRGSGVTGQGGFATAHVAWLARDVPPFGYRIYQVQPIDGRMPRRPTLGGETTAENEWFRVAVNPHTGDMTSLVDRSTGEDYLDGPGNEIVARRERDPSMEGMVRVTGEEDRTSDLRAGDQGSAAVESERTPLFQRVRTTRRFLGCTLTREVTLYAGVPRIACRTTFEDFRGGDVLVSVRFPVAISGVGHLVYETPYAMTERTRRYHCAQSVVDLNDGKKGLALINTGNAGYWPVGNALDLILFRSVADFPHYYAPLAAEHGTHIFDYALLPHAGDWRQGGVVAAGHAVNRPLTAFLLERHPGEWGARRSFVEVAPANVEVSAIKRAEEGHAIAIRMYETASEDTSATLALGFPAKAVRRATLEERAREELEIADGKVTVPLRGHEIATVLVELP